MNVHGGIVHTLTVTGDADIHGGIVKQLIVHGNCTQYGGIVNQRVIMAATPEPKAARERGAPYTAQAEPKTAQEEPQEPTIIYRDKVVYKEREKVVYRDRLPEECEKELKELRKLKRYYERYTQKLEQGVEIKKKEKARLEDRLAKALNRERVAVMARKDAEKELAKVMANQWDAYRPTKEEVRRYYNVVLALLDCETD
jgi:hypothetical protein